MDKDMAQILISEEVLQKRVTELAQELTKDYAGKNPVFVGVLKGVVVFFSDIIKQIGTMSQIDFMRISSYSGTNSTGKMVVKQDLATDIKDRHVVILEDIFDTGNSLHFTYNYLMERQPASLEICTLLDKPSRRNPAVTLKPKYVGFEVPDAFVVGYGLDFNEYYRNLPYIGVLRPEVYEK